MGTEDSRERLARHFIRAHHGRGWGQDSSLYAERAGSPLAGHVLLRLLPDYRPSLLVAVHVLAGRAGRGRSGGALLASLAWSGLHGVYVVDVQDVAPRHALDRCRPALVEGDQALH